MDDIELQALSAVGLVVGLMAGWWLVGWVLVPFLWRLFN